MARMHRVLTDEKKREIIAIVSVGCTRTTASRYVGCSTSTIRREAKRDPSFGRKLCQADQQQEIKNITSIQEAGKKPQYWRAAAWVLERRLPDRYAVRGPNTITIEQLDEIFEQLGEILADEIKCNRDRKAVVTRLYRLQSNARVNHGSKGKVAAEPNETSSDDHISRDATEK